MCRECFFFNKRISCWLCWVFAAARASHCSGFSYCGPGAQHLCLPSSRTQAPQLWGTGLAALGHVGSFQIRDRTRASCTGRQALHHGGAREASEGIFLRGQKCSGIKEDSSEVVQPCGYT